MAKKNFDLPTPNVEPSVKPAEETASGKGKKNVATKKANAKKRKPIGRFFRDIISELKKVDWAIRSVISVLDSPCCQMLERRVGNSG